jgi:hypothetical protein
MVEEVEEVEVVQFSPEILVVLVVVDLQMAAINQEELEINHHQYHRHKVILVEQV